MKKTITILLLIIFSFVTISIGYDSGSYIWSTDLISSPASSSNILETNSEIKNDNSLNLESGAAILIEQSTGQVLYEHNAHEQLRPASVTKVMSILIEIILIHLFVLEIIWISHAHILVHIEILLISLIWKILWIHIIFIRLFINIKLI